MPIAAATAAVSTCRVMIGPMSIIAQLLTNVSQVLGSFHGIGSSIQLGLGRSSCDVEVIQVLVLCPLAFLVLAVPVHRHVTVHEHSS